MTAVPGPTLALFAVAAGALIVTPGPAVLFIVARTLHQGRRAGVVSALGVATGGLVHVAGAVLGFSALLASSAAAFQVVKWGGAAYLVWLGVKTLRAKDAPADGPAPAPAPLPRIYAQGVLVNVLNPKVALFFLAFLPQFVDPGRGSVATQMVVLGGLFLALGVLSDSAYALLAGTVARRFGRSGSARRNTRLVTGGVYVALGAGAAFTGGSK
jgi:threonine/homoserine/homoserine lactone efflux protein